MGTRYFPTFGTEVNIRLRQVIYPQEMLGEMIETSWEDIGIYHKKQNCICVEIKKTNRKSQALTTFEF